MNAAPASKDFVRLLGRLVSAEGAAARATAIAETVDHVIVHGGGAWKELLELSGGWWRHSPAEARALLASGVPLTDMRLGDALGVPTWMYPESVRGMLEAGSSVKGSTALDWASAACSASLTRLLLAAGAEVDHVVDDPGSDICERMLGTSKSTALCVASRADAVDVAELLCETGAAVDPGHATGRPLEKGPLAIAAEHGSFAMLRFLVRKGAKLDVGLDVPGETRFNPLHCALSCGHYRSDYDVATFLIEAGANFNAQPAQNSQLWLREVPPFGFACELIETGRDKAQGLALAALMFQHGFDPSANAKHYTFGPPLRPIYAAIASGEPQLVSSVIAAGADVRGWVEGGGTVS
jgi:hypothetical protein